MTRTAVVLRVVLYGIAVAVAILLLATISERRFARLTGGTGLVAIAVFAGAATAALALGLRRVPGAGGCLPFAGGALAVNAVVLTLAATAVPGIALTGPGVVAGALLATVAVGIVFSLLDEGAGGVERRG